MRNLASVQVKDKHQKAWGDLLADLYLLLSLPFRYNQLEKNKQTSPLDPKVLSFAVLIGIVTLPL